jgi:hypothetical protein
MYGPPTHGQPGYQQSQPSPYGHHHQQQRNGAGVTALVLGVVSVTLATIPAALGAGFFLAFPAIIAGIVGLSRVKAGLATNRGLALAGLGLGIAAIVVSISMYALAAKSGPTQAEITACLTNPATDTAEEIWACSAD